MQFTFSRSGGPGGQNVNKVNTRVDLAFDVDRSPLSVEEKAHVRRALRSRIRDDGRVHVVASVHRTQSANRSAAVERLLELLDSALTPKKIRRATKPTRAARERRIVAKRRTSEKKSLRGKFAD